MKSLKSLIACGLLALPAFVIPAVGAPVVPDVAEPSASGAAADAAYRATLVQKLVGKWGRQAAQTYKQDASAWANAMASTFAQVSISTLELALLGRTFDEMNAVLVPQGGLVGVPAGSGLIQPKALGDLATDLVFVPITPCRIADTRLAGGQIATNTTRNFDVTAVSDYSFQGGSASNCGGAGAAGSFAAGAFNFTVVTPPAAGYITAFPFLAAMPLAATVNYVAGDIRGNFAIVKLDQGASANELSVYAATATHLVIDMVGYFIQAPAGPLECVETANTDLSLAAGATGNAVAPACSTGYTQTATNCESSTWQMPFVFFQSGTCSAQNNSPSNATLRASRTCCRVPGR